MFWYWWKLWKWTLTQLDLIVIPNPALLASICNNEYINLVSRETDFAVSSGLASLQGVIYRREQYKSTDYCVKLQFWLDEDGGNCISYQESVLKMLNKLQFFFHCLLLSLLYISPGLAPWGRPWPWRWLAGSVVMERRKDNDESQDQRWKVQSKAKSVANFSDTKMVASN